MKIARAIPIYKNKNKKSLKNADQFPFNHNSQKL